MKTACRRGFRLYLEKAGLEGQMPGIVACGGRQKAYERFTTAMGTADSAQFLLVDAEAPVTAPASAAEPWAHISERDGWSQPDGASDDQCHFMVEVMESWFLADKRSLADFYGQGFRENSLPKNPQVENIAKSSVLDSLAQATRATKKGTYSKGDHSFDILGAIDPSAVEGAAPYAKRFLDTLRAGGPT